MRLKFGNANALEVKDPSSDVIELVPAEHDDERITEVVFPDNIGLQEAFNTVTIPGGVVDNHFAPGAVPTWVWSDNSALAQLFAAQYTCLVYDSEPEVSNAD